MFINISQNKSRFFTGFALFGRGCRSTQTNEVGIDFFSRLGPTGTIENTSNLEENNVFENVIKYKWIFYGFCSLKGSAEVHK